MVQVSWVGGPLRVFLPSSVLFFTRDERINCPGLGRGFRPLYLDLFFSLFLALTRDDPAVAGLGYSLII